MYGFRKDVLLITYCEAPVVFYVQLNEDLGSDEVILGRIDESRWSSWRITLYGIFAVAKKCGNEITQWLVRMKSR